MKKHSLFLVILLILIIACAPQSKATSSPAPVFTNTPLATVTPLPTQTPEPTPASIPVIETPLESCTEIIEAKISNTGILEVIYADDTGFSQSAPLSKFGYSNSIAKLWQWSDSTQMAIPFPVPPNGFGLELSTDRHHIIFRRDNGENQSEIWVIDADGQNEKRLATFRYDEIAARYSADLAKNGGFISYDYDWIPNKDKIFYSVDALIGSGDYIPAVNDKFVLVDVNSGKKISLTIPADMEKFEFAPDGGQMAILTPSELQVLSTQDGQVQFKIQTSLNDPTYSPDGKYIVDFIDGGILRIDAKDGKQQIIPLKYTIMSSRTEGPSYGPLPDFRWIDNSTLLMSSLNSDKRYVSALLPPDPSWTFTVWEVDLANGSTHPIQTFKGDPYASFSPDMKRLAFLKYQGVLPTQTRDLILADLAKGKIVETIEGGVFNGWFPDSNRYLYTTGDPYPPPGKGDPGKSDIVSRHYLGQIGKEPVLVDSIPLGFGKWVDKNRLVINCKIVTLR
jgi:hypothetical protein